MTNLFYKSAFLSSFFPEIILESWGCGLYMSVAYALVFTVIYGVNDYFIDFLRRLKSPDRLDGNENSIFRHPLGLLEENFSRSHS